jgi:hypothetical protein
MNQIIVLIVSVLLWAQVLANEPRILMIHQALGTWRGVETDLLVRHKKFCDNNVVSHLIVPKISQMIPYLVEAKLPFVVSEDLKLVRCPKGYREEIDSLYAAMVKAVQYYALNVIFCTSFEQLEAAQRVKKQLPVKIIYIEHTFLHAIPHYFLEGRDQNLQNIYHLSNAEVFIDEKDIVRAFQKTLRDFYKIPSIQKPPPIYKSKRLLMCIGR